MTHQLTIEPIGDAIDVAEGQTILDACLRVGHLPAARLRPWPVRDVQDAGRGRRDRSRRGVAVRPDGFRAGRGLRPRLHGDAEVGRHDRGRRRGGSRRAADRGARLRRRRRRRSIPSPTTSRAFGSPSTARGSTSRPGQYVMVKLPGVEGARAFSIANAPSNASACRAAGAARPRRRRHGLRPRAR